MTNAFTTAFDAYAPKLSAEFVGYHARVITRLIERYEGNLRGLTNMGNADGSAYRNSSQFIAYENPTSMMVTRKAVGVDIERLQKAADEYAKAVLAEFIAKLSKKLAGVTEVKVVRADANGTFILTGKLGDKVVSIEQQKIWKVSSKGLFFHQWPARIYVDGQFTPEAAFKKLEA